MSAVIGLVICIVVGVATTFVYLCMAESYRRGYKQGQLDAKRASELANGGGRDAV